jgi:hypothetical protein
VLNAACIIATACGPGDGSELDERGRPLEHPYAPGTGSKLGATEFSATYEDITIEFLEPFCRDCHAVTAPSKGLSLTLDTAYDDMVGVPALQRSDLLLVDPGDPDGSYLIIKLEGTSEMIGRQMPRGRAARPQSEIDVVRAWIEAGAPRN